MNIRAHLSFHIERLIEDLEVFIPGWGLTMLNELGELRNW